MSDQKGFSGGFETLARVGSLIVPRSNFVLNDRIGRVLLERLREVNRRRELPTFHRQTFVKRARSRPSHAGTNKGGSIRMSTPISCVRSEDLQP